MSQDINTTQGVREPLAPPAPNQPWSSEAEADKLMDELFSDIDRILEGGHKLPTEPAKPEYVSLQPIPLPQVTMPPAVIPSQELPQQPVPESTPTPSIEPSEISVAPTTSPPTKSSGGWSLEKILLIAGLAALGATVILLLTNQQRVTWPWSPYPDDAPSDQNSQLSPGDTQFVTYMLRSLEVIEHKAKSKPQPTALPTSSATTTLQAIPTPGNRILTPNQASTYIPVYPSQLPAVPPTPSAATRPSIQVAPLPARLPSAAAPAVAKPAVPVPPPPAKPAAPAPSVSIRRLEPALAAAVRRLALPLSVQSKPLAASVTAKRPAPAASVAAKPPAPAASVAAKPSTPASPKAAAPAQTPPPSVAALQTEISESSAAIARHTLVGLLELGENSAALFEINGITQRINIGEGIGTSGWTLVSVANQEAMVRRNGEVRSVFVGQKF